MEQSTPPESWLVGVTAAGDQLASLRVHAGYLAAGPASGRPHRVHVRFRLHDPSPSGFPGAGEALDLNVAEERVVAAVRPVAVLVAVVTAPGFRDLVLHTDDPTRVALEVSDDLTADLGYEPTVDVDEDPAWSTYRSLFADAVVADGDRRVVAQLGEPGPDPKPCLARYFVVFEGRDEAVAARQALVDADFDATIVLPPDQGGPDGIEARADGGAPQPVAPPGGAVLVISDEVVLNQAEAARARDSVASFAASWGGSFQGWRADPLD